MGLDLVSALGIGKTGAGDGGDGQGKGGNWIVAAVSPHYYSRKMEYIFTTLSKYILYSIMATARLWRCCK
jgi:hypothetical protein